MQDTMRSKKSQAVGKATARAVKTRSGRQEKPATRARSTELRWVWWTHPASPALPMQNAAAFQKTHSPERMLTEGTASDKRPRRSPR
jgi:hypothetical protein